MHRLAPWNAKVEQGLTMETGICWQKSFAIATCQGSQDAEHHLPSVAFAAVAFVGRCSERPAAAHIMAIGSPWSK